MTRVANRSRPPGPGVFHSVMAGQTLARIAEVYDVPRAKIARANEIDEDFRLQAGDRLWIPGGDRVMIVRPVVPELEKRGRSAVRESGRENLRLQWPVDEGSVSSQFGFRGTRPHDGIDIAAPVGTLVRAAADGEVVFSSVMSGYGKVVILRHKQGYATLYGHNNQQFVREGDRVHAGQVIATVGQTGYATGPNLHFEVRRANVVYDPMYYLTRTRGSAGGPIEARARER